MADSDITYHSFRDVELEEPSSPVGAVAKDQDPVMPQAMQRQDSGYQSLTPRNSHSCRRRPSSTAGSARRSRPRPSATRRSTAASKPAAVPVIVPAPRTANRQSLSDFLQQPYRPHDGATYFHFPHFPYPDDEGDGHGEGDWANGDHAASTVYAPPPQTTHYWTSDHTRRLEYAAIDAASRGARGWIMRHIVPDCIVPRERRRLQFEDDRGSVVRYRLDLDPDESGDPPEKSNRRSWWIRLRGHH
ncbi:hypothetical protein VTK73DRAFT_3548 [Phialemonium thermophilum]|uniref:Uncharacterized protein n=1 Tax=Phialemonium thermophilum TaxID=223376 RepID=A0ABR3Y0S0_9PEZI